MARRSNNRSVGNRDAKASKSASQHKQSTSKAKSTGVEIFTASFCPHCQDAKMYMKLNNIKFTEYNLERSKGAEKKFLALGGKKIPLILVKGKILRSWNQEAFEKAYNS